MMYGASLVRSPFWRNAMISLAQMRGSAVIIYYQYHQLQWPTTSIHNTLKCPSQWQQQVLRDRKLRQPSLRTCLTFHENFMKIRSTFRIQEIKKYPGFSGLTATSRKYSRLLLASCPNFAEYFMKIRSSVFPLCCQQAVIFWKQKKKHYTPHFLQVFLCIMPDLSWQFHENPFIRFPAMLLTESQTNKQTYRGENTTVAARRRY